MVECPSLTMRHYFASCNSERAPTTYTAPATLPTGDLSVA